jgi:hypothetical protein
LKCLKDEERFRDHANPKLQNILEPVEWMIKEVWLCVDNFWNRLVLAPKFDACW